MKAPLKPARFLQLTAVMASIAVPAVAAAPSIGSQDHKVDGVRAHVHHGTLDVKGGGADNSVALRLAAGDPATLQVDVGDDGSADFSFPRESITAIDVKMGAGNDAVRIDDANGAFTTTIPATIAGGDGNDVLRGGAGAETFDGGDGNDTVVGGRGNDTGTLGAGDDTFRWDPGDGSDVVEGQDGTDTMLFNGAAAGETVTVGADGRRVVFFRQPAAITMDMDGVEQVVFHALGGQDNVTVGDLSGTDAKAVGIDLAAALGGTAGDGLVDNVVVNGTDGDDAIAVNGVAAGANVSGLGTLVSIRHADPTDTLAINTLAGTDHVFTSDITGVLQVLVDGAPV